MSVANPRVLIREPLSHGEAEWTRLVKVTYEDGAGVRRIWESAERTTRPPDSDIDGVDIVAIVQDAVEGSSSSSSEDDDNDPLIVLEKQFRPAVGRTVIELPAGLVDKGESPEQAAVRELREETGFAGVPMPANASTFAMFADPSFGNNNLRIVHLAVDRRLEANQNPHPALEDGELVQDVFCVPLARLHAVCQRLAAEGYAIDARVGTIAEALEMAKRLLPRLPA